MPFRHTDTYEVSPEDLQRFGELPSEEQQEILEVLQYQRLNIGLLLREEARGQGDAHGLIEALGYLYPFLADHGLQSLANHCEIAVSEAKTDFERSSYGRERGLDILRHLAIDLRDAEQQLRGSFVGAGGQAVNTADTLAAMPEADQLAQQALKEAQASRSRTSYHDIAEAQQAAKAELALRVGMFLAKLSPQELIDLYMHCLDRSQPMPEAIDKKMGSLLRTGRTMEMIEASLDGPRNLAERLLYNLEEVVTGKPAVIVISDRKTVLENFDRIQQSKQQEIDRGGFGMGSR